MSSACWCRKGSLPLALMKSAFGFSPHHRTALAPAPTLYRASKPFSIVTSPRGHPSTSLRLAAKLVSYAQPLSHRLRRGAGPERPGVAVEADGSPTPEPAAAVKDASEAARAEPAPKASLTAADGSGPRRSPRLQAAARPLGAVKVCAHLRLLTLAPGPAGRYMWPRRSTAAHRRCAPACWRAPPRRSSSYKGRSCARADPSPRPAVRRCGRPHA
jgi:hypothetical protein